MCAAVCGAVTGMRHPSSATSVSVVPVSPLTNSCLACLTSSDSRDSRQSEDMASEQAIGRGGRDSTTRQHAGDNDSAQLPEAEQGRQGGEGREDENERQGARQRQMNDTLTC